MPTDGAAVEAERRKADTATSRRKAECGENNEKRGPKCTAREEDEAKAASALADATVAKATTDRAAQLESDAAEIRARLATAPAVKSENALGEALGRLLPVSALTAATLQQALVSGIAELLIAAALALPELLRNDRSTARREPGPIAAVPEIIAPVGRALPSPRRARANGNGKVVPIDAAREPGDVAKFAVARLRPRPSASLAIADLYEPYRTWCGEEGCRAVSASEFSSLFAGLCDLSGFKRKIVRGQPYCLGLASVA